jgi:aldehyde:ferredoxin oxidoreductase
MQSMYNKYLDINVTTEEIREVPIPEEILTRTLGGKGLATHLLLQLNPPKIDPLSPENHFIIAVGPITGTKIWGSCRYGVYSKSPQTGFYAESYSGGTVAEYVSKTGYDAIVISGKASKPVWLDISNEKVTINPADDIWGQDTYSTEEKIKKLVARNCGVACIGPAGENGISYAVIENDKWRSAGRTGMGAVLGSKKVKGIAFHGKQSKTVTNPAALDDLWKSMLRWSKINPEVMGYKYYGTTALVDVMNAIGAFPTRYWHLGSADHKSKINASALHNRCSVIPHACLKCFMACGRKSVVKEGKYAGLTIEGPEYETIFAFGGLCEVQNIEDIVYLNDICDRLGMDTITAGNLAAFAIEGSLMGKIPSALIWGDTEGIATFLHAIAYKKNELGEVFAKGIKFAAAQYDMEEHAIHVKGLEPAGYDPRVMKGMALAYATSDRGACHLRATYYKAELLGLLPMNSIKGKVASFCEWEDLVTMMDTLILCRFYRDLYKWDKIEKIINYTTGLSLDETQMRSISANILNQTRLFNLREGLTSDMDKLPSRFHTEPLNGKKVVTKKEMDKLLRDYYKERKWTSEGVPKAKS